jgi:hypothetical protein
MPTTDPVEFSIDDAILNAWEEEPGEYLRLDPPDSEPDEPPPPDVS